MRKAMFGTMMVLMSLMVVSMASADVMVLGTVYEETFGGTPASSAGVTVTCAGATQSAVSATGTYAFLFNDSDCPDATDMTLTVTKTGFKSFSGSKTLNYSTMMNFAGTKSLIIDMVMAKETSTGGSTGGSSSSGSTSAGQKACKVEVWDCEEWSECENDTRTRRCDSNCNTFRTESDDCSVEVEGQNVTDLDKPIEDVSPEAEDGEGFFSTITGAVTGSMSGKGVRIALIFVVIVIVALGISRSKTKGKDEEE